MFLTTIIISLISMSAAAPVFTEEPVDVVKYCHGKPADIFFLLDSSSSIWIVHYREQLKFLHDIVSSFPISMTGTRIGVGIFSHLYNTQISFNDFDNVEDLQDRIKRIPHMKGSTFTGKALTNVREEFVRNGRPGVAQIVVVLTDGASRNPASTMKQAKLLKEQGVYVFAIGIGKGPNMKELQAIGSIPSDEFVYRIAGFHVLKFIKDKLAMKVCRVPKYQAYCSAEQETDVMFAFDSASMGTKNVRHAQNFISNVVGKFGNMAEGMIRAGMLSGFCESNRIDLNQYSNKEEMSSAVRNTQVRGLDYIVEELHRHSYNVSRGGRENARKMAVLFVDDSVEKFDHLIIQSERAKAAGIRVYVVGVGDVDEEILSTICSSPPEKHVMRVSSYNALDSISDEYSELFCEEMSVLPDYE
ncbi:cartilage matrix protein-like [Ylistrum balloti]|uniref:cartilage matrix protein-like n=1 Tax=Ylistrum balloti TaxID=509963 RepID=UPI002905E53D|nr:cartilage matrix protein-like [Ylistrum balloti]